MNIDNKLVDDIEEDMANNNGKLSKEFIEELASKALPAYVHMTPRTRVCILMLESGHEVLGHSMVLDAKNDVEAIGNKAAFNNAVDKLWELCGAIALVIK